MSGGLTMLRVYGLAEKWHCVQFHSDEDGSALCKYCGYCSMDFEVCEGCSRKLPVDVKVLVKRRKVEQPVENESETERTVGGEKINTSSSSDTPTCTAAIIDKKAFYGSKLQTQNSAFANKMEEFSSEFTIKPTGRTFTRRGRGAGSRGVGRTRKPKEPKEPVTLTISSDEDDGPGPNGEGSRRVSVSAGASTSTSQNDDDDFFSAPAKPTSSFGMGRKQRMADASGRCPPVPKAPPPAIVTVSDGVHFNMRGVRVGSMRTTGLEVRFMTRSIQFKVIGDRTQEELDFFVYVTELTQILFSLNQSQPVAFLKVSPGCGNRLRSSLRMMANSPEYFDPGSQDPKRNMIVVIIDLVTNDKGMRQTLSDYARVQNEFPDFLQEITYDEANDLLVKSTPGVLTNLTDRALRNYYKLNAATSTTASPGSTTPSSTPQAGSGQQETFLPALRDCQWQRVRQLVQQGSSQEQRDVAVSQAVSHSQWGLVVQLVQLGVSQQCRDLAAQTAARHCIWDCHDELLAADGSSREGSHVVTNHTDQGQWELVFAAVHLGIDQRLLITILKEMASQRQWEQVPSLTGLCNDQGFTDFILHAAVECSQWDCVQRLFKTGLTRDQQAFVCKKVLEWAHFDCAVELLRPGCEPDSAERIVPEAFWGSLCWNLVDLLREDGSKSKVRDVILRTAKTHVCCAMEYLMILKEVGATEKEMVDLVTTAFHAMNFVVMLELLSLFASARRVFKQVLLRTRFPAHVINTLHTRLVNGHPDLAFYMFTAQDMWDRVIGMFKDARLNDKQRRFALKHAIRKRAWETVIRMVKRGSLSRNDQRYAFLQAARRGEWRLSLRLSNHCTSLSVSDKVFALRFWLRRGLWHCVQVVQENWVGHYEDWMHWRYFYTRAHVLECVLEESIIAEKLEAFTEVCNEQDPEDTFRTVVFDTAIEHDKCNFIVEFCRLTQHADDFEAAVQLAIEKKKWGLLKNLIEENSDCVYEWEPEDDFKLFCLCVRSISIEEDSWQIVVPALNGLCDLFQTFNALVYWDPDKDFRDTTTGCLVRNLAAWCLERSYGNAALVLSVISGYTENVTRVIDQLKDSINRDVLMCCFAVALNLSDWESAVTCLQHLSFTEADTIFDEHLDDVELVDLMETCRERAQYMWVVYLGVYTGDWEQVRTALELCEDTSVVDYAIRKASSEGEWDIVESQLARCSQDNSLLGNVFASAVTAGRSDMCTDLISKINNLQTSVSIQSLLCNAVTSSGNREEMVKLCIEFGLSTHITTCTCTSAHGCSVCGDCPIKTALNNGQMPLVKLLYQAGACSNTQLFRCKENADLRNQLQGQRRQGIVEYLDHAATTPRTLQDLCRLQVSHLIGCHPGRVVRVMSLDIYARAKDLINFKDVLS